MHTEKEAIMSGNYPHFPLLPMKRWTDGRLECGILIAPRWNRIVLANMFLAARNPDSLTHAKVIEYRDLDALLLDGWTGD